MRPIEPLVLETLPSGRLSIPGAPPACRAGLVERARLHWYADTGGDPAARLADFLTGHGLPVADLARAAAADDHRPGAVCGAAVLISAAAGARITGAAAAAPTPAPAVPDLVAVIYAHPPHPVPPPDPRPPATPPRADGTPVAGRRRVGPWRVGPWRDSWTTDQHAAAVERARAAIGRGDVYQVNLVGHAHAAHTGDPVPALTRLAGLPGARYGGVLTGPGWAVGCASPETLVTVDGTRLTTRPIKGTRPATTAGRRDLLASAKERAEHVMIVDLERNDLARVAATGSVRVDDLYTIRRWCDLWQAESTVTARLADGAGLTDLLRAVCPGGSVTGAPKLAALTQIADLEPVGRGPAMGAFGWIGAGRLDLGLTIRTAAAADDRLHLWAGGGITWGSDPDAEVAEAAAKAAPLRAALAGPTPPPTGRGNQPIALRS
ncbi:chorismate-binding protein [Solwaraspora sp. WMMD1047]|uniref:chorismate-binding protein n=1 Tax=Solwaraspora sp. WMMD1047 TaxID=3016102 RepID=UPI0024177AB1|nr:chorismate-binding protein [Solwaraspora sp. WMMD1047]MDG4831037.1 chorismate-binding protein [Solwaraspora sp. WMMD1047]